MLNDATFSQGQIEEVEVPDETRGLSKNLSWKPIRSNQLLEWFVEVLFLNLGHLLESFQRFVVCDVPCVVARRKASISKL
jgi:hypothetical protein